MDELREEGGAAGISGVAGPHPGGRRLYWILTILFAGFFVSLVYHYQQGVPEKKPYPFNTFLFVPNDQFMDFYNNFLVLRKEGPESVHVGWGSALGTLRARVLYVLFYPKSHDLDAQAIRKPAFEGPFIAWSLSLLIFAAGIFYLVVATIRRVSPEFLWVKSMALILCAYPVWVCLDRSNFESTLFLWLAAAIFLYQRGRFLWAAVIIGAAAAAKVYMGIFLVLFLTDRHFKEIFIALGVMILLTAGSLCLLPGDTGVRIHELANSMALYNKRFVLGNNGVPFGSSLYGMAKVVMYQAHIFVQTATPKTLAHSLHRFMRNYIRFVVVCFGAICLLLGGWRMELWKKTALLVCSMNLFPFVCADYRLLHLFIPLLLFLREEKAAWGDRFFSVVFALLLIPKDYYHFTFDAVFFLNLKVPWTYPFGSDPMLCVTESVVLNPLLMAALVIGVGCSVLRRPRVPTDLAAWLSGLYSMAAARFGKGNRLPA